jgi:ketosteroid isomerase-like protein
MHRDSRGVVERYWLEMGRNDWHAAAELLREDFVLEWPQSGECFRGRQSFIAVNANYPASGPWRFTVNRIVAEATTVVSDVSVTDGTIQARAVTFFTVEDGRICRITEFWPDPFTPAAWRSAWATSAGPLP